MRKNMNETFIQACIIVTRTNCITYYDEYFTNELITLAYNYFRF